MAKTNLVTVRVNTTSFPEVIDLLSRRYGYESLVFDPQLEMAVPNPQTKEVFVRRFIRNWVRAEIAAQRKEELPEPDVGLE